MSSSNQKAAAPREAPQEPFKRAIAGCLRAMARAPELEITFAPEKSGVIGIPVDGKVRLTEPPRHLSARDAAVLRGQADLPPFAQPATIPGLIFAARPRVRRRALYLTAWNGRALKRLALGGCKELRRILLRLLKTSMSAAIIPKFASAPTPRSKTLWLCLSANGSLACPRRPQRCILQICGEKILSQGLAAILRV